MNRLYLSSLVVGLGFIISGAKICEWGTKIRKSTHMPAVVSNKQFLTQFDSLEQDAHVARQDMNVAKYYFGVQTLIAVGFFTYMFRTGNSIFSSILTASVASTPGFLFAKMKIDTAADHLDSIERAERNLLLMESTTQKYIKKL